MKDKANIISKSELIFKVLYLISMLFAFNGFIAGSKYITYFNYLLVLFGGVLLAIRALNFKRYIKTPLWFLLVAFCASMALSIVLNAKYGFLEGAQSLVWTTLQFGMLYMIDERKSIAECKKELVLLSSILCGYVFIANVISIVMFLCNYGYPAHLSPSGNNVGFVWGRLWGVYLDPNNGSVLVVVSALLCMCAFSKLKEKKLLRIFLAINIFLDYIYIMLSDSRTGFVVAFISVTLVLFLLFKGSEKIKFNLILKNVLSLVLAAAVSFAFIAATQSIKTGYNYLTTIINSAITDDSDDDTSSDKNELTVITGRDSADTESDISNRRFSLWQSGIEIWKTSPIYGVSQRNILPYAKENVPKTYMVNNDMGDFDSSHNMFIDVLVGQGIIGLAIIIAFFMGIAVILVKGLFLDKENKDKIFSIYNVASIGILSAFACSSMFVLDVLYLNSVATVMFWAVLGYLIKFISTKKELGKEKASL